MLAPLLRPIVMAAPPPPPPADGVAPARAPGTSVFVELPPADEDPRWDSAEDTSLTGTPPVGLLRLLWTHWAKVDLRHRGVAARLRATIIPSLINGLFGLVDWVFHGRAVAATPLCERPVFVLGLPRSGTTMLHELLAADKEQFVAPDTFQIVHSSSFLTARPLRQRMLAGALKATRPMDNVAQSWDGTARRPLAGGRGGSGRALFLQRAMGVASRPAGRTTVPGGPVWSAFDGCSLC